MKKGIFLSLILILAVILNIGCDALDYTDEITFEIELVAQSDEAVVSATEILMADSLSSEIDKYSGLIKKIELLDISYQIISVGDSNLATKINSATLSVADESGTGEETVAVVENQDIVVMSSATSLPMELAGMNRFADLIKADPHHALIRFHGSSEGAPVDFTVKFFLEVKMTASPL